MSSAEDVALLMSDPVAESAAAVGGKKHEDDPDAKWMKVRHLSVLCVPAHPTQTRLPAR